MTPELIAMLGGGVSGFVLATFVYMTASAIKVIKELRNK